MKKKIALALVAVLGLAALAGCTGTPDDNNDDKNTAPEILGVKDTATTQVGVEFDALKGVTATDKEDGDLTSQITVESSSLTFTNGKVTPANPGEYELIYEVEDKGGLTANAYCTLTVTRAIGEETDLYNFTFADAEVDDKGWTADIGGEATGNAAIKQGAYVFEITNSGTGDNNVTLIKNVTLTPDTKGEETEPASYEIKFWMKSSVETYAHFIAEDASTDEWKDFGGKWNEKIGTELAPFAVTFTIEEEENVDLRLHLGKITPNPDNPEDTSASAFTVTIEKIELFKTTGVEVRTPVFTEDFSGDTALNIGYADDRGASASFANADGAAKVTVASYGDTAEDWMVKAALPLASANLEAEKKYSYSFDITAKNAQNKVVVCVESDAQEWQNRCDFNDTFVLKAGEKQTVTRDFNYNTAIDDLVLRFYLGVHNEGVTENEFVIDNIKIESVVGDKETKTQFSDTFTVEGNADNPWTTYNEGGGIGSVYTDNGKLVYRIEKFGTADWHNKLVFGYGDYPLELPYDAYFTVTIKVKATKDVSCVLYLNETGIDWDLARKPIENSPIEITTEEKTFTFVTTEALVTEGTFEMLFQNFVPKDGNRDEGVTIEISELKITQKAYV